MKNKVFACIYGLAIIAGIINFYISYKEGNGDAMVAWICSSGMAAGAAGAFLELIRKEDDENNFY